MNVHRNARTTPHARALIVERHAAGEMAGAIAAAIGIARSGAGGDVGGGGQYRPVAAGTRSLNG